ncbi:MAG: hypothetical protein ACYTFY_20325 [Planctomycetota bacterium]|jgi:hypothetical protein
MGGWSIHQASYQQERNGRLYSILQLNRNPGLHVIYLGFLMICLGTTIASFHGLIRNRMREDDE